MNEKTYQINEVFYSLQGEGARAGTANLFVRFSGCNLTCRRESEGFDCDTEFTSGVKMTAAGLLAECRTHLPDSVKSVGVIFTGGEPTLQLDDALCAAFHEAGFRPLCIETNGTNEVPRGIDWISVSPKTAEHTLRVGRTVHELRYVRRAGMGIPRPTLQAGQLFISPAFTADGGIDADDLAWCIEMVKEQPHWRLSVQQHKGWRVR